MRTRPIGIVAAGIAAFLALQSATFGEPQGPVTDPSKIKEIDWTGMSDSQKKIALKLMNTNGCNCRCKMTVASCRASDETCRRSLIFARTVVDTLREGKPEAAVASMAAHAQGKFWQLHDKMFQNFTTITEESIKTWAKEVGLNMKEFEKVMQSGILETQVQKDMADGAAARVLGTPTLFIDGKRVQDRTFEGFKKVILEELAAAKTSPVPPGKTTTNTRTSGH